MPGPCARRSVAGNGRQPVARGSDRRSRRHYASAAVARAARRRRVHLIFPADRKHGRDRDDLAPDCVGDQRTVRASGSQHRYRRVDRGCGIAQPRIDRGKPDARRRSRHVPCQVTWRRAALPVQRRIEARARASGRDRTGADRRGSARPAAPRAPATDEPDYRRDYWSRGIATLAASARRFARAGNVYCDRRTDRHDRRNRRLGDGPGGADPGRLESAGDRPPAGLQHQPAPA